MNKTLYIHIGSGKTGSTALQSFLACNEDELSNEYGIKYICTGRAENKHRALDYNAGRNNPLFENKVNSLITDLNHEILNGKEHSYIISDEDFPGLTDVEISNYRRMIDSSVNIKVIVYLRRQDTYVESWFNQIVKTGQYSANYSRLLNNIEKKGLLNYHQLLSKWALVFGKSNIIVRPYEFESFIGGNIFTDFMSIFSLEEISFVKPSKDSNPGLSRDKLFLLRKISNAGLNDLITKDYIKDLIKVEEEVGDSKFVSSPASRKELLEKYSKSNMLVAKEYLSKNTLFRNVEVSEVWHDRVSVPDRLFLWSISYFRKKYEF